MEKNNIRIVDKRIGHSASKGCQERAMQSAPWINREGALHKSIEVVTKMIMLDARNTLSL